MSCLDKLTNNPTLPQLPSQLQSIIPSNIENLSAKTKTVTVGNAFSAIKQDIKNQVSALINNTLDKLTGNVKAAITEIKNITSQLKGLPTTFTNALANVEKTLAKQFANITSLIECEINSTYDSITKLIETADLQSNINQAASNLSVAGITNSVAKTLTQNSIAKELFVNNVTDGAVNAGTASALTAKSNSAIVAAANTALNNFKSLA